MRAPRAARQCCRFTTQGRQLGLDTPRQPPERGQLMVGGCTFLVAHALLLLLSTLGILRFPPLPNCAGNRTSRGRSLLWNRGCLPLISGVIQGREQRLVQQEPGEGSSLSLRGLLLLMELRRRLLLCLLCVLLLVSVMLLRLKGMAGLSTLGRGLRTQRRLFCWVAAAAAFTQWRPCVRVPQTLSSLTARAEHRRCCCCVAAAGASTIAAAAAAAEVFMQVASGAITLDRGKGWWQLLLRWKNTPRQPAIPQSTTVMLLWIFV